MGKHSQDRTPKESEKGNAKKNSFWKQLQGSSPFSLTEKEQEALDQAQTSGTAENPETPLPQPKEKKKRLSMGSPFALTEEEMSGESDENSDLDAKLQEQEESAYTEPESPDEKQDSSDSDAENEGGNVSPADTAKKKRRHWYGIPLGSLVVCFALVGMIFTGTKLYGYIYSRFTNDSAARAYDSYLLPVVMLDPEPFESINAANKENVLLASLWKTIFENAAATTEYDESARMIFQGSVVRHNAAQLFGPDCVLTNSELYLPNSGMEEGAPEGTAIYDYSNDTYHVPLVASAGSYQPYTLRISTKDSVKRLQVAYCVVADSGSTLPGTANVETASVEQEDAQMITTDTGTLRVVKVMEYEISIDPETNGEYISAIRELES